MCNGHCYNSALLLVQAFLDTDDDVNLIYADVDSLKLNPKYIENNVDSEHCFVERIMEEGYHVIYDILSCLAYNKDFY